MTLGRLPTFEKMEACSHKFISYLNPPGEAVEIPYEDGKPICGYFVRAPFPGTKLPVLICMGGLDSIKDEMWFMQAHGCLQRGISVLMIDGPGQGGTLRRHKVHSRPDTEVPIGKCIDWLLQRDDVDPSRIAVCGSSMGGYYAARAGCHEHRLAAAISHGAIWSVHDMWGNKDDSFGLAMHIKWVLGATSMKEAHEIMKPFTLEGHLEHMKCPYLIVHGGHDVLTVTAARQTYDYAKSHGVDATLRILDPDETGAEHCQHDNPTIGQEILADWLGRRLRHRPAQAAEDLIQSDDLRDMIQGIKTPKPGIVAIDLHRGHLDLAVATMPLAADAAARVVAANERFFNKAPRCRNSGVSLCRDLSRRRRDQAQSGLEASGRRSEQPAQARAVA